MRRTRILVTLGPATQSSAIQIRLLGAGVDGFRVNFAHGTDSENGALIRQVRRAARVAGREVAILADLQGPKIRIGDIRGGFVSLSAGQRWVLDGDFSPGNSTRGQLASSAVLKAARPGSVVLLGDGSVRLRVEKVDRSFLETRVVSGGRVDAHAGLHLPGANLRAEILGRQDLASLRAAVAAGADYVGVSFVSAGGDLRSVRKHLSHLPRGARVGLVAKIERAEALARIDGILAESEGIMVARGDLGIEVPLERLALEQKALVRAAREAGRFSIVATQMLLSMVAAPRPTRAEATDVANAVLDGADTLMLSEESAIGAYPLEAVGWLDRIARATEPSARSPRLVPATEPRGVAFERSVARAAVDLAEGVRARAIVTPTHSGKTARWVAAQRPDCPILALSPEGIVRRQLALVWGVATEASAPHLSLEGMRRAAWKAARRLPGARTARPLVATAGYPIRGSPTNLVTVLSSPRGPEPRRERASRRPFRGSGGRGGAAARSRS